MVKPIVFLFLRFTNMMEEHTFVIPVYKESPYLEECIKSLVGQSIKSKIIITTSTPSVYTKELAGSYDIPYFVNDNGYTDIATNWNFALSKTDTKYVTIAHQDDIYDKLYAEVITAGISRYHKKQVLIAFTNYIDVIDGHDREFSLNALVKNILLIPFFFSRSIKSTFLKKMVLLFGDPICCPSVTFNMEELGVFAFSHNYNCVIDWYAWYSLAKQRGAFLYINKKLMKHRLHTRSVTSELIDNGERRKEELQMFEMMWGKSLAKLIALVYSAGHKDNLT